MHMCLVNLLIIHSIFGSEMSLPIYINALGFIGLRPDLILAQSLLSYQSSRFSINAASHMIYPRFVMRTGTFIISLLFCKSA
jgi:hypothetical protein